MNYIKYPSNEAVEAAIRDKEPMLMLISFDGETVIMSHMTKLWNTMCYWQRWNFLKAILINISGWCLTMRARIGRLSVHRIIKAFPIR